LNWDLDLRHIIVEIISNIIMSTVKHQLKLAQFHWHFRLVSKTTKVQSISIGLFTFCLNLRNSKIAPKIKNKLARGGSFRIQNSTPPASFVLFLAQFLNFGRFK
jgi:hypothetical protein